MKTNQMKQLLTLVLLLANVLLWPASGHAGKDNFGGEKPFPYGPIIEFPWGWVDGCWRSKNDDQLAIKVESYSGVDERYVKLEISKNGQIASGVGHERNEVVSALMAMYNSQGQRILFLSDLGGYCVKKSSGPGCFEALGLSLIYETGAGIAQDDHVLIRTNGNFCKNSSHPSSGSTLSKKSSKKKNR